MRAHIPKDYPTHPRVCTLIQGRIDNMNALTVRTQGRTQLPKDEPIYSRMNLNYRMNEPLTQKWAYLPRNDSLTQEWAQLYRVFAHDVTAAILVSKSNEMAAINYWCPKRTHEQNSILNCTWPFKNVLEKLRILVPVLAREGLNYLKDEPIYPRMTLNYHMNEPTYP